MRPSKLMKLSIIGLIGMAMLICFYSSVSAAPSGHTYIITATADGGYINPSGNVVVNEYADQEFIISAASPDYHIADVLVDGASVGAVASYTFTNVRVNHTIRATFALDNPPYDYTITPSWGPGGSINPGTPQTVNHGGSITFTITANTGYHIEDVLVDGASVGAVASYTFSNVTADHTIYASFETDTPPSASVVIYVFQDDEETFAHHSNIANYPEVAFVTLVAVKEDSNGKLSFYDGSDGPIKIDMRRVGKMLADGNGDAARHHLVNLTDEGLVLHNVNGLIKDNRVNWQGFYHAMDYAGEHYLVNILAASDTVEDNLITGPNAPDSNLDGDNAIVITGGNPNEAIAVIAVKTWCYKKEAVNINFELQYISDAQTNVKLTKEKVPILLNIDNIELARENRDKIKVPGSGEHFTNDPGKFVITGTIDPDTKKGKEYTDKNIIHMFVEAQKREGPRPHGGDGVDWLGVAAADIYNTPGINPDVFKCVWMINAADLGELDGQVSSEIPYLVNLNPYKEWMRFNSGAENLFAFFEKYKRDDVIHHESLHAYSELPGEGVYDEEDEGQGDDFLIVGEAQWMNPYFKFCWDDISRGFLTQNPAYGTDAVESWLQGLYGDYVINDWEHGYFITRIDDKLANGVMRQIFKGENIKATVPSPIPSDLPFSLVHLITCFSGDVKIYLYNHITGQSYSLYENIPGKFITHALSQNPNTLVSKPYGHYRCADYVFEINGYKQPDSQKFLQLVDIRDSNDEPVWHLYVLLTISYKPYHPAEFDASYFGIAHEPHGG